MCVSNYLLGGSTSIPGKDFKSNKYIAEYLKVNKNLLLHHHLRNSSFFLSSVQIPKPRDILYSITPHQALSVQIQFVSGSISPIFINIDTSYQLQPPLFLVLVALFLKISWCSPKLHAALALAFAWNALPFGGLTAASFSTFGSSCKCHLKVTSMMINLLKLENLSCLIIKLKSLPTSIL